MLYRVFFEFDELPSGAMATDTEWIDAERFKKVRHIVRVLETKASEPAPEVPETGTKEPAKAPKGKRR